MLLLHLCWLFFSTYIRIWTLWQDTHSLGPPGGAYLSPPLWALDDGSPPLLDRIVPTSLWTRRPSTPFPHLTINRWNWQRNKVEYEVYVFLDEIKLEEKFKRFFHYRINTQYITTGLSIIKLSNLKKQTDLLLLYN